VAQKEFCITTIFYLYQKDYCYEH